MLNITKKDLKTNTYVHITASDAQALQCLHRELRRAPRASAAAANDILYEELEARYGGGFAQWVADRMRLALAKENPAPAKPERR